MKKKSIIYLLLAVMIACLALAGCGGGSDPETITLESWMAEHPEELEALSTDGIEVTAEGNTLFYMYDVSSINGLTEETALSDAFKEAMEGTLDDSAADVINEIGTLEEKTGVDGITGTIVCKYKDTVIAEKSFTTDSAIPEKETNDGMTLEQWIAEHPEEMEGVEQKDGLEIIFDKNCLIYSFDLSYLESIDESTAYSEEYLESLKASLAERESSYVNLASTLEQETGIDGITVRVIYHFKGETILEETYSN